MVKDYWISSFYGHLGHKKNGIIKAIAQIKITRNDLIFLFKKELSPKQKKDF